MVAAAEIVPLDEEPVGVAPEVKQRLVEYIDDVASGLKRVEQRHAAGVYARGLIESGARKSLEPMVARLGPEADYEALQHFLADSPWDAAVIERAVAERLCAVIEPQAWVLDDTGVVKDGKHSPGVKRQYSGTLGKTGNCQVTVSLHAVGSAAPSRWGSGCICRRSGARMLSAAGRRRSPTASSLRPSRRSAGSGGPGGGLGCRARTGARRSGLW